MIGNRKLPQIFYERNVHKVAKDLLGKFFTREINDVLLIGKIVEVEVYRKDDQASHSFSGRTKRNEVMFDGGGKLYVYFTYGMHYCANVVTGRKNEGSAILIRALEPLRGIEVMAQNRYGKKEISKREFVSLCNGPAKICDAFNIERSENGLSLNDSNIFILDAKRINTKLIGSSRRIGIKKSVNLQWRYFLKNNPFVSHLPAINK